jgi:hypothetical protein
VPHPEPLCRATKREQGVAPAAREQRFGLGPASEHVVELRDGACLNLPLNRRDPRPPLLSFDLKPRPLACSRLRRCSCGARG